MNHYNFYIAILLLALSSCSNEKYYDRLARKETIKKQQKIKTDQIISKLQQELTPSKYSNYEALSYKEIDEVLVNDPVKDTTHFYEKLSRNEINIFKKNKSEFESKEAYKNNIEKNFQINITSIKK